MTSAGRIFISYRREDTAYPAGWLFDRLAEHFGPGQVFKDVDSVDLGDDFAEVITTGVGSCDVLLALIGDRWLSITDDTGRRRLDDPDDFVRLEIETALARGIRVIPILVGGARIPRAEELPPSVAKLARRQALELSPSRFEFDTNRLLKGARSDARRRAGEGGGRFSTERRPRPTRPSGTMAGRVRPRPRRRSRVPPTGVRSGGGHGCPREPGSSSAAAPRLPSSCSSSSSPSSGAPTRRLPEPIEPIEPKARSSPTTSPGKRLDGRPKAQAPASTPRSGTSSASRRLTKACSRWPSRRTLPA